MALDRDGPIAVPYAAPPPDFTERSIHALFEAMVARAPDAIALCDRASRLTFAEVHAQVIALARRIADCVPRSAAVGILLPTSVQVPIAMLASLVAGRTCLAFDVHQPTERIAGMVRDAAIATLIIDAARDDAAAVPDAIRRIAIGEAGQSTRSAMWCLGADDPAIVVYTSGSTGRPKGVVQSQRAILCRARQVIDAWHMHRDDGLLSLSIPTTIAGLTCCIAALLSGSRQVIVDLLDDSMLRVLTMLRRERVTIMIGFPDLLRGIVGLSNAGGMLAGLRIVRTAGGALLRSDVEAWRAVLPPGCHLMTTFGSTEMMTFAQRFVPPQPEDTVRLPAGYPLVDHEFMVVDTDGQPVPLGDIGELVVRSRHIAVGEWQEGRCVPGRFLPVADDATLRVLFTGDLIRQRADGLIEFIGRRDTQLKLRGQRVELAEIEAALRSHSAVSDAAVVAEPDGEDVILRAFIVATTPDDARDAAFIGAIRERLAQMLPAFMVPARIESVAALPRLASGKLDRRALLGR